MRTFSFEFYAVQPGVVALASLRLKLRVCGENCVWHNIDETEQKKSETNDRGSRLGLLRAGSWKQCKINRIPGTNYYFRSNRSLREVQAYPVSKKQPR